MYTKSTHYVVCQDYYRVVGQLYLKNKLIEKKIRFVVTGSGRWAQGDLDEGDPKVQTYRISKSSRNVMYMMNMINTAVCSMWTWIRELIPKFSQEKNTFLSIWGDGCLLCLSWSSFHKVRKSNCYTVHLKLRQCCMSSLPQ